MALVSETTITPKDLGTANRRLDSLGCQLTIQHKRSGLYLRGTFADEFGESKQRTISLKSKATAKGLQQAENRSYEFWKAYQQQGWIPNPLPWATQFKPSPKIKSTITCQAAIKRLHDDFWEGKDPTRSQSLRTWERIRYDLELLPPHSELSADLLAAVIERESEPNSRKRHGMVSNYKRLARLLKLTEIEPLDQLQRKTNYKAKQRDLTSCDEKSLITLMRGLRKHTKYGWALCALITYGCRPSEVWSLQPSADGTGRCLDIKEANGMPQWRTVLALPPQWVEEFNLLKVERPLTHNGPADYDSIEAMRLEKAFGKWLRWNHPTIQLYDLRHSWAHRQILGGQVGDVLGAQMMGHSIALHQSTYFQAMQQRDAAVVAERLRSGAQIT